MFKKFQGSLAALLILTYVASAALASDMREVHVYNQPSDRYTDLIDEAHTANTQGRLLGQDLLTHHIAGE